MRRGLDGARWSTVAGALAGVIALTALGCADATRSRCDRICSREAGCAEELKLESDRFECIEACVALERQPATRTTVMRHVQCVDEAAGCEQVMACE